MRRCILALGLVACGPSVAVDHGGTDGSTGADDGDPTSASAASTMPDPGTTMPGTTMTSSSDDDDDESGAADDYPSFVDPTPDVGAPPITGCSIWERDCPVGMKCMPYANDGASSWNDTICTPLADEPQAIGDPCTAPEGAVAGVDDCDIHSMCWDVDPETLEGTCVSFCSGSADDPSCDDPTTTCIVANEGALVLCLPSCHPLDAPCSDGLCMTLGEQFFCLPEPTGVGGS